MFRRLAEKLRRHPKKDETPRPEPPVTAKVIRSEPTPEEVAPVTPTVIESERQIRRITPIGALVATREDVSMDAESTANRVRAAHITSSRIDDMVPGRALKRDAEGRIHIKIVFYGPSLSGKTTALRWLFANVRYLSKSKIVEIADELGRTTFFDFIPVAATDKIVFDVFTVAGQRRHAQSRIFVLRDADGIIFMADSRPESMNENIASMQELRIALGTDRFATLPIIIALNKRDLPNALPEKYMINTLGVEGMPVFLTVATEGKNLIRMFQRVLRDTLIFRVGL